MAEKETVQIALKPHQINYLKGVAAEYDLPDIGKAVRCLVEYAREEAGAKESIFTKIRCHECSTGS